MADKTLTFEVPEALLKAPDGADRLVNEPLLLPGVKDPVGIVRETSKRGKNVRLKVEVGAGLEPVLPEEPAEEGDGES